MKDNSPHAMGYSYLNSEYGDTEVPPLDELSSNGDVSVDPVTATKSNSNLSEGGNQVRNDNQGTNRTITEVPPGVRAEVRPGYGETDTLLNRDGSRLVRQRSAETGILNQYTID